MSLPSSLVSIWLSTKCSNACTSQNPHHHTHKLDHVGSDGGGKFMLGGTDSTFRKPSDV
jgi:hypothetical protein